MGLDPLLASVICSCGHRAVIAELNSDGINTRRVCSGEGKVHYPRSIWKDVAIRINSAGDPGLGTTCRTNRGIRRVEADWRVFP